MLCNLCILYRLQTICQRRAGCLMDDELEEIWKDQFQRTAEVWPEENHGKSHNTLI
jgi:hypothetical protein